MGLFFSLINKNVSQIKKIDRQGGRNSFEFLPEWKRVRPFHTVMDSIHLTLMSDGLWACYEALSVNEIESM